MQMRLYILALLLPCLFMQVAGAVEPQSSLEQRVQVLEQQVQEITDRLQQLEQNAAAAKPAHAVPLEQTNSPDLAVVPGWQTTAAWEKLRRGMNQTQVTQIMGNPAKRSGDRLSERWLYPDNSAWVEFDRAGEVRIWQAPVAK